jgi:hypothetical protein
MNHRKQFYCLHLLCTLSILLTSLASALFSPAYAQSTGSITGTIKDKDLQQPVSGATVRLIGQDTLRTQSDAEGNFTIKVPTGRYTLEVQMLGYAPYTQYQLAVTSGNPQVVQIELEYTANVLAEVTLGPIRSARAADMVTPLSTQKLTSEEIRINPGGNFDVSKVIQVLPGVSGGTSANRNDIIVRGGGPAENVYYLDGIEIPVLNHFQTQGASGGATGILNVSFIDDVQLSSSAFDARYDNALASTFVIKQRNGNPDRLGGNIRLSGSEFATTFEGPLSNKTTFMASARRSYLQFLFQLLDLPIRPDYWDFQYKVNHQLDEKTQLTFLGLGAIDNFRLEAPTNADANSAYILRSNPLIKQWNYTIGASLKRLQEEGYTTFALSRNMFFNGAKRYENNAEPVGTPLYKLGSHEIENKFRMDVNRFRDGRKWSYGLSAQYAKYDAQTLTSFGSNETPINTVTEEDTKIDLFKLGAFGQVSNYFLQERLLISAGIRTDVNSFTKEGFNALKTLSPRLSASYILNPDWNISGSIGRYFKMPSYTALGYRDAQGNTLNASLPYIQSIHYTAGTQYSPRNDFRFTLEAFYKDYKNYPVSLRDGISVANSGTDFSAIGNEAFIGNGKGRVYGAEAYVQQKLVNKLFYVVSATLYRSEFSGADGKFAPSTWDYGFTSAVTVGYTLPKRWEVGVKYRYAGGQPYTPFDEEASQRIYLANGRGVYDYTQLNQQRLPDFQQLDIRIDKTFNFKSVSLIVYADIQNALLYKTPSLPKYTFERNAAGTDFETTDGQAIRFDGSNAIPLLLRDRSATAVPSLGFIFEF